MGEYYPAEIHIGGPIRKTALNKLVKVIVSQGVSLKDYDEAPADEYSLKEAFGQATIVKLYDDQASYGQFDELEAFLVRHRIHFERHSDAHYEFDAENVNYRGGKEPTVLHADQAGNALLDATEVRDVLNDASLDDPAKINAIRKLAFPPETSPLTPVHLI